jgi:general secretion pathway protein D
LGKLVNVNIHLDDEGLKEEGQSPDTPVTLELASDIQLKSYLNLILEKYHLCYIIKNEVLNITSETKKQDTVHQVVYPVGDLVMPIPNFVASPRMGLAGAFHDAMGDAVGTSSGLGTNMAPTAFVASKNGQQGSGSISPQIMANMAPRLPGGAGNQPSGFGPGGAGGGTNADFDTLIDLITQTVAPATWDHNGGKGNIAASPTNLSLVVSQTQEVHEQIVDLLEQLRRMQDLQVTIEVRFITLSDSFFERIGVDFDFNIVKNVSNPPAAGFSTSTLTGLQQYTPGTSNGTSIAGITGAPSSQNPATTTGLFTSDLSIPFSQGSYALGVPQFGGFDATAGATVGFAILSDIEAYFFINAAQGDRRSNVLQAPKVTLFNGQQAFVSDTSQTPFVISVIPVVGEFAAAQQPVIVVLSEGTFMTVQAVVSNDRRFVRLTVVPFFSKIGNVQTFTFQGTDSTTTDTTQNGGLANAATNLFNNNSNHTTTSHSGVTVQLPTFSFVTVTTTVSVPDGGTVLLGGIKRLSEGRNEFGVPILDKVPYLDRLFKNVGIGRDTSSLMMMVTPRIIIQEEEEDKMGVNTTGQ